MLAIIQTTLDSLDDRKFMSELYEEYGMYIIVHGEKVDGNTLCSIVQQMRYIG